MHIRSQTHSIFSVLREAEKNVGRCLFYLQHICSVVMATHFEVHENALPELAGAQEVERADAVSTAVQWVNGPIAQELQGIAPSQQAEVDQRLR